MKPVTQSQIDQALQVQKILAKAGISPRGQRDAAEQASGLKIGYLPHQGASEMVRRMKRMRDMLDAAPVPVRSEKESRVIMAANGFDERPWPPPPAQRRSMTNAPELQAEAVRPITEYVNAQMEHIMKKPMPKPKDKMPMMDKGKPGARPMAKKMPAKMGMKKK